MKWGLLIPATFLTGCATMPSNPTLLQKRLYEKTVETEQLTNEIADCKESNRVLRVKLRDKTSSHTKIIYVPVPTRAINEKELEDIKKQAYDDAMEKFQSRMKNQK